MLLHHSCCVAVPVPVPRRPRRRSASPRVRSTSNRPWARASSSVPALRSASMVMRRRSSSRPVVIDDSSASSAAMADGLPERPNEGTYHRLMLARLDLRGAGTDVGDRLPRPDLGGAAPVEAVREILAEVKKRGDAALREYSQRFDGVAVDDLSIGPAALDEALAATPAALREALEEARAAILAYHRSQLRTDAVHERDGVAVREFVRPIDLVVQAEHGPDGLAWLITWSPETADAVSEAVARLVASSPRRADLEATLGGGGYAVLVDGPEQAAAVFNAIAPEHLELMNASPEALVPLVRNAGAVFCGVDAPASVGDYIAGPSHVLPTFGTARFSSALRVDDFLKLIHVVSVSEEALARVAPDVAALAEAEGLPAHAESVRLRGRKGSSATTSATSRATTRPRSTWPSA